MKNNFNKKKFTLIPITKLIKYSLIISILLFIFFLIYDEFYSKKRYREFLEKFSSKYSYQLELYQVNHVSRVNQSEISKIINDHLGKSIFLISLSDISYKINNLKWVKSVNLSTNLKNKINIEILEYEPVGLYLFNNQIFYLSKEGKLIERYDNKIDEQFIIFSGTNVLNSAFTLLDIIDKLNMPELKNIEEAYFINERRWNLKLNNKIILFLSEKDIATSLINYIKLIKQLKESEVLLIKSIDLRNNNKAIMNFK